MKQQFIFSLIGILLVAGVPLAAALPSAFAEQDNENGSHANNNGHKHNVKDNNGGAVASGPKDSTTDSRSHNWTTSQSAQTSADQSVVGAAILKAKGWAIMGSGPDATIQAATVDLKGIVSRSDGHYALLLEGTIDAGSNTYQVLAKGSMNTQSGHNLNLLLINGKASNGSTYSLALRFIVIKDSSN